MEIAGGESRIKTLKLALYGVGDELRPGDWSPSETHAGMSVSNEDRLRYHMAEFTVLKSEVSELVKQTYAYLTYAVGVSGAIFSWLLTRPAGEHFIFWFVWLPFLACLFFCRLAIASRRRINLKGAYLRRIEDRFRAPGLGWERAFQAQKESIASLHSAAWHMLFWGTLIIAIVTSIWDLTSTHTTEIQKPIRVELVQ